jgi:hydrogenase nickel incorporation protein HypA/HybF
MHELSVTEQLLEIVLDHARKAEAKRVLKVNLVIGELTGFVGESIQFCFDMLSKETEAESASLSISRIPAKATCRQNFIRKERTGSVLLAADRLKK